MTEEVMAAIEDSVEGILNVAVYGIGTMPLLLGCWLGRKGDKVVSLIPSQRSQVKVGTKNQM